MMSLICYKMGKLLRSTALQLCWKKYTYQTEGSLLHCPPGLQDLNEKAQYRGLTINSRKYRLISVDIRATKRGVSNVRDMSGEFGKQMGVLHDV